MEFIIGFGKHRHNITKKKLYSLRRLFEAIKNIIAEMQSQMHITSEPEPE